MKWVGLYLGGGKSQWGVSVPKTGQLLSLIQVQHVGKTKLELFFYWESVLTEERRQLWKDSVLWWETIPFFLFAIFMLINMTVYISSLNELKTIQIAFITLLALSSASDTSVLYISYQHQFLREPLNIKYNWHCQKYVQTMSLSYDCWTSLTYTCETCEQWVLTLALHGEVWLSLRCLCWSQWCWTGSRSELCRPVQVTYEELKCWMFYFGKKSECYHNCAAFFSVYPIKVRFPWIGELAPNVLLKSVCYTLLFFGFGYLETDLAAV